MRSENERGAVGAVGADEPPPSEEHPAAVSASAVSSVIRSAVPPGREAERTLDVPLTNWT
jgi:hypothetical protein